MPDGLDPLPESLREFLDAEKSRPDPSPDVQQRTLSRLAATLGLTAGLGDGPAADSSPPAPATASPRLARVLARGPKRALATFLFGAAVGATAYGTVAHFRQDSRSNYPPIPAVVAPPSLAPVLPALPLPVPAAPQAIDPAPRSAATAPSNPRGSGEPTVARPRDAGLAAERNLIEIARTALTRGHIDGALATLHRHVRQYPKGQFVEERDSLLVQALVAKGDHAQARERAARFRRQHPSSLFLPAVDQALQSIP